MIRIGSRLAALAAAASMLPSCGGGSGGSGTSLPPSSNSPSSGNPGAEFVVRVPEKAPRSGSHRPAYITSNVQGIDFTVTSNGATNVAGGYVYYALTPQQTYCSSANSVLTCKLQVNAPPGNDQFVVNLYDDATAPTDGFIVASATVNAVIAANAVNTVNVTTDGVPTFAVVGANIAYPTVGVASTIQVPMTVTDPDGNIIVGSFDAPLTLTDSDTSGATTLSKTTLNQASDAANVSVSYNGASISPVTIAIMSNSAAYIGHQGNYPLNSTVIAPGGSGPNVAPAALFFPHANSAAQTVTVTAGPGSLPPFTLVNSCSTFVTVSGTSPTFSIAPIAPTFDASNPVLSYGYCYISVQDLFTYSTPLQVMVGP